MASLKLGFLFFSVLLHAVFLLPHVVNCDDEEDLLQGINSYRTSLHLPALTENPNANCLADKIADKLSNQSCNSNSNTVTKGVNSTQQQQNILRECHLMANSTAEGVALPVCVHKLDPKLVLNNYTMNHEYAKYLNSSKYLEAGLGCDGDWMVVVLTTRTPNGSFVASVAAASLISKVALGSCCFLLLGLLLGYSV